MQTASALPDRVECPAFPLLVKALAGAIMAMLVYWGWRVFTNPSRQEVPFSVVLLLGCAALMLAACFVAMLRSRTSVTRTHLHQTWLWDKRVALAEITQVKLIYLPFLAWLVAPRVVVRVGARGSYTFYASEPALLRAFVAFSDAVTAERVNRMTASRD